MPGALEFIAADIEYAVPSSETALFFVTDKIRDRHLIFPLARFASSQFQSAFVMP
jgi:hypothetical protein